MCTIYRVAQNWHIFVRLNFIKIDIGLFYLSNIDPTTLTTAIHCQCQRNLACLLIYYRARTRSTRRRIDMPIMNLSESYHKFSLLKISVHHYNKDDLRRPAYMERHF